MDVHPPHQPLHTWKDFWIHLGTITVGLLIAIGLEQSVEKLHQVHERHVLQAELRDEGLRNRAALHRDFERMAIDRTALVARRRDVEAMIQSGGKSKLVYHDIPNTGTIAMPSEASWDSAKASGRVALLPDAETDIYSFLYLQDEWIKMQATPWFASQNDKSMFERRFDPSFAATGVDGTPDLGAMSLDDLKQYSMILDREITQRDSMVNFLRYYDAVNEAVLGGAASQQAVIERVDHAIRPAATGQK